jgi:hypothetical protein
MCVSCGCNKKKGQAGYGKGPSKSADKKQDAKVMKGMSPKQKSAFEKADKKMDAKKPSAKADAKMDKALAAKVKKAK